MRFKYREKRKAESASHTRRTFQLFTILFLSLGAFFFLFHNISFQFYWSWIDVQENFLDAAGEYGEKHGLDLIGLLYDDESGLKDDEAARRIQEAFEEEYPRIWVPYYLRSRESLTVDKLYAYFEMFMMFIFLVAGLSAFAQTFRATPETEPYLARKGKYRARIRARARSRYNRDMRTF